MLARWRGSGRLALLLAGLILVLYQECFWYGLWWGGGPEAPSAGEGEAWLRLLLVADPQLQGWEGEAKGPLGWLTRHDADRYLASAFAAGLRVARPHAVVFLGDLLDEGLSAPREEFQAAVERFQTAYASPGVPRLFVPGDNDVGGESEPVDAQRSQWFHTAFPDSPHKDFPDAFARLSLDIANVFDGSVRTDVLNGGSRVSPVRLRVLLSHHAVLRDGFFRTRKHSAALEQRLRPQLVLAAHDHWASAADSRHGGLPQRLGPTEPRFRALHVPLNSTAQFQLQIPTTSYRMGVYEMALGILDIRLSARFYSLDLNLLYQPHRFQQLLVYLAYFCLATAYLCLTRRKGR